MRNFLVILFLFVSVHVFSLDYTPFMKDYATLEDYLSKALPDDRAKFYTFYLDLKNINAVTVNPVYEWMSKDLLTMKNPEVFAKKIIGLTTEFPNLPFDDRYKKEDSIEKLLSILLDSTKQELVLLYYAGYPYAGLSNPEMKKERCVVLKTLLDSGKLKPTPASKQALLKALLVWPDYLKDSSYDTKLMRDLIPVLVPATTNFMATMELVKPFIQSVDYYYDSSTLLTNSFKQTPTNDEKRIYLAMFFNWQYDYNLETDVFTYNIDLYKRYEKSIASFANSEDETVRLGFLYLKGLQVGIPDLKALSAYKPADIKLMKNETSAFFLYKLLTLAGTEMDEDTLIGMLDISRVSLTTAILYDLQTKGSKKCLKQAVNLCSSKDEPVLLAAIRLIGKIGKVEYLQTYIVLLDCPFPNIRHEAANMLVRYGDGSAVAALMKHLYDTSLAVRLACIEALGAIRDSRPVDTLAKILLDPKENEDIKTACARALGRIGDRRMIPTFISLLKSSGKGDTQARIIAAAQIGYAREKTAIDALIMNIDPKTASYLNTECIKSLGMIHDVTGQKKLIPLLKEGYKNWSSGYYGELPYAFWALYDYKDNDVLLLALDLFKNKTTDYSDSVFFAAYYLDHHREKPDPVWKEYLLKNISRVFDSYSIQFSVLLEETGEKDYLIALAKNVPNEGSAAQTWMLSALAKHPDPLYFPYIKSCFESYEESVRIWACEAVYGIVKKLGVDLTDANKQLLTEIKNVVVQAIETESVTRVLTRLNQIKAYIDNTGI